MLPSQILIEIISWISGGRGAKKVLRVAIGAIPILLLAIPSLLFQIFTFLVTPKREDLGE